MAPSIIDTHAHLYDPKFDADRDATVARAREAGVKAVLLPAVDLPSIEKAIALCEKEPGFFYAMAALHPSETAEATAADFDRVAAWCRHPAVVAVGESGLDYYWDRTFDEKQQEFFRMHIRLAAEAGLPLVLHNREASEDLVRILQEERAAMEDASRLRGVFHCFGGPSWVADAALEMDFFLGIGGTLTFKNGGVPAAIENVPLERILLETDAPYLAPVPFRGKRNESAYTAFVAARLAEVKGVSLEVVAEVTTRNSMQLFNLPLSVLSEGEVNSRRP